MFEESYYGICNCGSERCGLCGLCTNINCTEMSVCKG